VLASKGLEIDLIGYIIIALVGIGILVLFVTGPLNQLLRGTFCYFYTNVLQQTSDYCKAAQTGPEFTSVSPPTQTDLARYIAAYSIQCWRDERPVIKKQITCFSLNLKTHPGPVYEFNVTQVMETEGGCSILQNSQIIDENGNSIPYSGNCGSADNLVWQVSGNSVTDQQLILIIYDATSDKIIVQA
jgi:hypothetical protein